jgi:hypothetical protein
VPHFSNFDLYSDMVCVMRHFGSHTRDTSPGYGRDEEEVAGNVEGAPALRLLIVH